VPEWNVSAVGIEQVFAVVGASIKTLLVFIGIFANLIIPVILAGRFINPKHTTLQKEHQSIP
jgi:hypothetical protein